MAIITKQDEQLDLFKIYLGDMLLSVVCDIGWIIVICDIDNIKKTISYFIVQHTRTSFYNRVSIF